MVRYYWATNRETGVATIVKTNSNFQGTTVYYFGDALSESLNNAKAKYLFGEEITE